MRIGLMKVDEKKATVSFNTFVSKRCSFEYYKSIIIHEFVHLVVQKVPNKEDATRLKDDFGDKFMRLIDLEADYFTAQFYKEVYKYSLVQYLQLYYDGSKAFSDKWIRKGKLERFIGTILSISKMYIDSPNNAKTQNTCNLYLPTISPLYTEDNFHVLLIKKEHISYEVLNASYMDFMELRKCYSTIDDYSYKGYVCQIIKFVCKAFDIPIPKNIEKEIFSLPS
jgi:hypothetical protein